MTTNRSRIRRSTHLYLVKDESIDTASEAHAILEHVGITLPNVQYKVAHKDNEQTISPAHLLAISEVQQLRVGLITRSELRKRYQPTYINWSGVKQRCKRNNSIQLHPSLENFADFLEQMGPRPEPDFSLDRIDPTGPYAPSNLRWASKTTQSRNRTNTVFLTYKGIKKPLTEWAEENGVDPVIYRGRKRDATDEEVIDGRRATASHEPFSADNLRDCWIYTPWPVKHREFLEAQYQRYKVENEHRLVFMERHSLSQIKLFWSQIEPLIWPDYYSPSDAEITEMEELTRSYNDWSSIYCESKKKSRHPSSKRRVPTSVERKLGDYVQTKK